MQQQNWRTILQRSLRSPQLVIEKLGLTEAHLPLSMPVNDKFPLRVTGGFMNRIRRGDANDPLLRQILPLAAEAEDAEGYTVDPLSEHSTQPVPGLLHKYHGRALLIVTGACAIHCRYCFRRHFPYADSNPAPQQWRQAISYLRGDSSINEIILSGGDPLTLPDDKLRMLVSELSSIPHLRRLRIHSRIPVVLPERIDNNLAAVLTGTRFHPVMVVHANHPNEINETVRYAIDKLRDNRILILNQSVLLRGINDSVAVLSGLSEKLFDAGIMPYYLHMLDPVKGTAHFSVPESDALLIIKGLREKLPGYLVPRLVREVAGNPYKLPLDPA